MEFKDNTTFQDVINLVISVHLGKLMHKIKRVKPIKCKTYELHYISQGEPYLCCYKKNENQTRLKKSKKNSKTGNHSNEYFLIRADIETIYDIYRTFEQEYINKNYEELYEILSQRNDCRIERSVYKPEKKVQQKTDVQSNLIDINNVTETELSKLPGINIILAKRIIQQREFINGYKSKEEFYDFCALKPHFIEQIEPLIVIGEFDIIDTVFQRIERTVDTFDEEDDCMDDNVQDDDDDNIIVDF
jgi:DNA uptake protein ComE-like DNA-binding protein